MPLMEFEHTILAIERVKTHALDRAATGIGSATDGLVKSLNLQWFVLYNIIFIYIYILF